MRTGWRWRPALRLPRDDARRIGSLAGAGILALVAQQAAVVATIWLSRQSGDDGTFTVYTYAQAVYLLPYAVLAVPVATPASAQCVSAVSPANGPTGSRVRLIV